MELQYPVVKQGRLPGTTSVILAGIHGNEPCGINAFEKLIPTLTIERGTVIFDIGNPMAVMENKRFIEYNMNRLLLPEEKLSDEALSSKEFPRSREIMKLLDSADALLDIHSTRNIQSYPFAICEHNSISVGRVLPFDLLVTGFDKFEPGATDGYMKNKIGVCVECGQHQDPKAVGRAIKSIHAFLDFQKHTTSDKSYAVKQRMLKIFFLYQNASAFKLARPFADFEKISKHTLIGYDGEIEVRAPKNCIILFAHDTPDSGKECFLLAHEKK